MTDRPILFSAPMVRALQEGRKTQTRRVLKLPTKGIYEHPKMGGWASSTVGGKGCYLDPTMTIPAPDRACIWHQTTGTTILPPYDKGDRLWVRETWTDLIDQPHCDLADAGMTGIAFRATGDDEMTIPPRWRPGIYMPRWASRLTLIVTDVRVQRLQDISETDALAEGIERLRFPERGDWGWPQRAFETLWDSLNAKRGYGWETNPWVCAVTFAVHQRNIDQMEAAA